MNTYASAKASYSRQRPTGQLDGDFGERGGNASAKASYLRPVHELTHKQEAT
jgi:hypothetical protein